MGRWIHSALCALAVYGIALGTAAADTFKSDVACVQSKLQVLGAPSGPVNGKPSAATDAALAKVAPLITSANPPTLPLNKTSAEGWCDALASYEASRSEYPDLRFITDLPATDSVYQQIRAGALASQKFIKSPMQATFYIYEDAKTLVERRGMYDAPASVSAEAVFQADYVNANLFRSRPSWFVLKTGAHEFEHLYHDDLMQHSFGGSRESTPWDGPYWLTEGLAEYVGYLAIGDVGARQWQRLRPRASSDLSHGLLGGMGPWKGFDAVNRGHDAYSIAHAAVELLVKETSVQKVMHDYWVARNDERNVPWEQTFGEVFGMSPDAFYKLAAAHSGH